MTPFAFFAFMGVPIILLVPGGNAVLLHDRSARHRGAKVAAPHSNPG
jgi:hypothetical protein